MGDAIFSKFVLGSTLVPKLVNKPAPKPVAEAAKAFNDHNWDVPKLLASSATGNAWRFWQLTSLGCANKQTGMLK